MELVAVGYVISVGLAIFHLRRKCDDNLEPLQRRSVI